MRPSGLRTAARFFGARPALPARPEPQWLTRQESVHLLWTGGITAAATLYLALYLRPRPDTRRLVSIPEDTRA
ncbi:hypothetical protein [Streptomyces sp. NPDC005486]|uniref:hypothetical protein n=1 Tax=Streptomyces sp. NPDC005486 TaxID=3155345 RepID=UPI00339E0C1E